MDEDYKAGLEGYEPRGSKSNAYYHGQELKRINESFFVTPDEKVVAPIVSSTPTSYGSHSCRSNTPREKIKLSPSTKKIALGIVVAYMATQVAVVSVALLIELSYLDVKSYNGPFANHAGKAKAVANSTITFCDDVARDFKAFSSKITESVSEKYHDIFDNDKKKENTSTTTSIDVKGYKPTRPVITATVGPKNFVPSSLSS